MNKFYYRGIGIDELACAVPKNTVKIEDKRFSKIVGIEEKRVTHDYTASYLGYEAAKELDLTDVKFIIFASQTHDHYIPFISNKLQADLGLPPDVGTMDINTGCTGFILGLATAFSLCHAMNGKVLFVIGDTLAKTTGDHDPASSLIFGDAAAACTIDINSRHYHKEAFFSLYSDGARREAIRMTGGGFAEDDYHAPKMYMDGDAVLQFALREIPAAVRDMEHYCGKQPYNYIYHQSNKMILNHFRRDLPFYATMPTSIEKYGNTSGASIPLTIATNNVQGLSLLCGYGSGLTWGTAVMDIDCDIKPIVEV